MICTERIVDAAYSRDKGLGLAAMHYCLMAFRLQDDTPEYNPLTSLTLLTQLVVVSWLIIDECNIMSLMECIAHG